jgi:hypothetical protein
VASSPKVDKAPTPTIPKREDKVYHELIDDFDEECNEYYSSDSGPNPKSIPASFHKKSAKSEEKKKVNFYAELISDKGLPSDIPPIRVLINEQIASSAIDSIKDSQRIAHELSKSILLDYLDDEVSINQFGEFLKTIFGYESLQFSTRDLIYWSLSFPEVHKSIYSMTQYQTNEYFKSFGKPLVFSLFTSWLTSPVTYKHFFIPQFTELLRNDENLVKPFAGLIASSIPNATASLVYPNL